jgi:hypothetical protein
MTRGEGCKSYLKLRCQRRLLIHLFADLGCRVGERVNRSSMGHRCSWGGERRNPRGFFVVALRGGEHLRQHRVHLVVPTG